MNNPVKIAVRENSVYISFNNLINLINRAKRFIIGNIVENPPRSGRLILYQLLKEHFLIAKIIMDHGHINFSGRSNVADGCTLKALFGKETNGLIEDMLFFVCHWT